MQKVKLHEVFEIVRNGASIKQINGARGIPITRIETIAERCIDKNRFGYANIFDAQKYSDYYLKDGDILMSHINSEKHLGKVAICEGINDKSIIHGMNLLMLRAKHEMLCAKYAFYYFSTDDFLRQISKITKNSVNQSSFTVASLKQIEIPLPPMEEQRAIAEKLDKVSQLVDKRKEQLQQLDQLVKSQFINMFGDPAIDEDNGETLGDYFNIVSGGTPDTKNMDYWQNGTIPWIGSSACQNCVIKTVNQKFITQMGLQHSSSKILGAGTVLVALVGATIGKTALLKCETAINQNIAGIKVLENKQFTPQYVFYAMQFLYKKFMEIGGDKFKMANLTFIRGLPFAKQPIVLQNKFAEFVERVDKLKEKVNNSLTHLNLLKQSLMQQYFN